MVSLIQNIMFKRKYFTTNEARKWLKKNKFIPIKRVDKTNNELRYRIKDPRIFKKFRVISLKKNKIQATIGFL